MCSSNESLKRLISSPNPPPQSVLGLIRKGAPRHYIIGPRAGRGRVLSVQASQDGRRRTPGDTGVLVGRGRRGGGSADLLVRQPTLARGGSYMPMLKPAGSRSAGFGDWRSPPWQQRGGAKGHRKHQGDAHPAPRLESRREGPCAPARARARALATRARRGRSGVGLGCSTVFLASHPHQETDQTLCLANTAGEPAAAPGHRLWQGHQSRLRLRGA